MQRPKHKPPQRNKAHSYKALFEAQQGGNLPDALSKMDFSNPAVQQIAGGMIGRQPKETPKPAGQVEYEFAKEHRVSSGSYIDFVQAKKGKGVTVNVGKDESFKVPAGFMKGEDGKSVVPIPGGPAESKFTRVPINRAVEASVRVTKNSLEILDTPDR